MSRNEKYRRSGHQDAGSTLSMRFTRAYLSLRRRLMHFGPARRPLGDVCFRGKIDMPAAYRDFRV
jgi:hypothetical protein